MFHCRSYSAGKPSPFNDEAVNSNLFDKAKATPLPSSEEAGQAAERLAAEPSTAGRPLLCGSDVQEFKAQQGTLLDEKF